MTELLDDPPYTLDQCAETVSWRADSIPALRTRLRERGLSYRVVIDHEQRSLATLVDTFDWRVLSSGRVAVSLENESSQPKILHQRYRRVRPPGNNEPKTPGAQVPVSAPALVPAPVTAEKSIRDCIAPRVLLKMGSGELSIRRGRLINGVGKTEAILDEISVCATADACASPTTRVQRFLLLRPLRGFRRIMSVPLGTAVDVDELVDILATGAGRRPFDSDTRVKLPIRGDDDPDAAHHHVVSRLVQTMAMVRPGIGRVGDPEFLHDYRVALRRLRSYLKEAGLGPPPATPSANQNGCAVKRMDAVWEATGVARDYDVFLERRPHYLRMAPAPLKEEVAHLFDGIASSREESYQKLFARLPVGFESDLEDELLARGPARGSNSADGHNADGPHLAARATRWVRSREKKFLKLVTRLQNAYAEAGEALDDEKIHATRKAAKKYRYLHEIFLPVLDDGKYSSKRVKRLRKLQNLLGSYNDLVVEEARFHEILTRKETVSYGDIRAATAYMLAQVEWEKEAARERVLKELSREVE